MTLFQDLRYAVRMLAKAPGFTAVAVITLALGIGANTAIFSVIDAVLVRGLPYQDPDRLAIVWEHNLKRGRPTNVVGPANYVRWVERNQSFEKLAAFTSFAGTVTGLGEPESVPVGYVTADFFETLGAQARIGRAFGPEHSKPGPESNVAVVSHAFWQRRMGGDASALGRKFEVNSNPVTVIGVMPEGFRSLMNADFWVPTPMSERHRNHRGRYMSVIGRLKPGVTRDQAQAEMAGIAKQIEAELPDFTGGWSVNVVPLREQLVGNMRPVLLVLFGAVGFVLLIACGNVANLLLARAMNRQREMAVRTALGASRGQLLRQLLTESLLLAFVGGAAGTLLGVWAVSAMQSILPPELARFTEVRLNPMVFGFTFAITLLTGVFFGIAPAYAATRGALQDSLKEGTTGAGTSGARARMRSALVVAEVALSLVLLVGAGLLLKSFAKLNALDPGFDSEQVLSMAVSVPGSRYNEPAKVVQFYDKLMPGVESIPGVKSAGAISWQLLGVGSATSYEVPGEPKAAPGQEPAGEVRMVTPRLFETLGIPVLRGRVFDATDTLSAPRRVVVNDTMARTHWPNEDPIGKRIVMSWGEPIPAVVIGVVGDVRLAGLDAAPRATMYWAQTQMANNFMTIMIRSERDPADLVRQVKEQMAAIDPLIPLSAVRRLDEVKANSLNQRRFSMLLLGIFAAVALVLAAVGIYGVMAYSVSQRTREIGVRMALGAQPSDVVRMVLGHGTLLAVMGVALGLAAGVGLSRFLATMLFEVSEKDPLVFAGVAVLLAAIALAACAVPARRAAAVDPLVALRYE